MSTPPTAIEVANAVKSFGTHAVLDRIDLTIPTGSTTAILGASGSGKTTLLRLIAGFETLDTGRIAINGRTVDDGRRAVNTQYRAIGYVPQDGGLFPHLSVCANVGFGLRRSERHRVNDLLDLVGLTGLGKRRPHQLSGGQQQRVALARALAIQPRILLLDEPFSSLDATLRASMRRDLKRILATAATTTILVTHDRDEALSMADRVAVLADGHLLRVGDPRSVYGDPGCAAAARLSGEVNLISLAQVSNDVAKALAIDHSASEVREALWRPEQIGVWNSPRGAAAPATITDIEFRGHESLLTVRLHDSTVVLSAITKDNNDYRVEARVWVEATSPPRLIT